MLRLFRDSFIFGEAISSHIFRVVTSTQQNSYFFRVAVSSEHLLFLTVIFSEQLLFQGETSTEQPPLENRKFFRVATFRSSYLFGEGIV